LKTGSTIDSTRRILESAASEICEIAFRIGIDGAAVLAALPEPGTLLTGANVPVLTPKDRGKASILFHINRTRDGVKWPFLQFYSFRHGGMAAKFNGLQWLRRNVHKLNGNDSIHRPAVAVRTAIKNTSVIDDLARLKRDDRLSFAYSQGQSLDETLCWAQEKFAGYMDNQTLTRITGRNVGGNRLLFPMETTAGRRVGYHQILTGNRDEKRHYVRQTGLMAGSFVRIGARSKSALTLPPIICEGVSTAMSIALVWPGAIFAALCAGNLKNVRQSIYGPVILAADNDQWKVSVGNVGIRNARTASEVEDIIRVPAFRLAAHIAKPTDFNDLLLLEGYNALHQQITGFAPPSSAVIAIAA